jgi:hypothetical protein
MFEFGIKTKRNVLMLVLAILTANSIPAIASVISPFMSTKIPIPLVETVGGIVGIAGLITLYWLWNKDV